MRSVVRDVKASVRLAEYAFGAMLDPRRFPRTFTNTAAAGWFGRRLLDAATGRPLNAEIGPHRRYDSASSNSPRFMR